MKKYIKEKYKVKSVVLLLILATLLSVTGCSSLDYSLEEEDMIADYAAYVVLKHDVNYKDNYILETTEQETSMNEIETIPDSSDIFSEQNNLVQDDVVSNTSQITQALDISGLNAEFVDYTVVDSYPYENVSDASFVMKAVNDSKLLVAKFRITNNTNDDISINMMKNGRKYKGIINGNKKYNAQITLLLDALNTFDGTILAQSSEDFVIVFQTQLDTNDDVKSFSMEITDNDGNTNKIKLK